MKTRTPFFAILSLSVTLMLSSVAKADPVWFGIVPQQSASRLAQLWVPLMEHLKTETQLDIRFTTAKDIPTFEACLAQGAYDVSYMNPYHYTVFHDVGYEAIARQADKKLRGLIVVRDDAPFTELKDLDGQVIAFPSPAAFGASVLPRAEMTAQGMTITPRYVRSHDSVYRAVLSGALPAGGGVLRTFNNQADEAKAKLRIIYRTDGYTPHAFAVHQRLGLATTTRIQKALIRTATEKPALLKALGMKGLEPAQDQDWDDVRGLNLTRAQTEITETGNVRCHSGSKRS